MENFKNYTVEVISEEDPGRPWFSTIQINLTGEQCSTFWADPVGARGLAKLLEQCADEVDAIRAERGARNDIPTVG